MLAELEDAGTLFRQDPCLFLYHLAKSRPGQNVKLSLAGEDVLVVQDFDDAEHILSTQSDNYLKNFSGLDLFLGRSRLTTDGDIWRRLQKLSQPIIARVSAEKLSNVTHQQYAHAAAQIQDALQSGIKSVDVMPFIDLAAASVLFDLLLNPETEPFLNSLIEVFRGSLLLSAKISWSMGREASPLNQDEAALFRRNRMHIAAMIRHITGQTSEKHAVSELIQNLTGSQAPIDIQGELNSLIFAGFDTSSTAVGWGLFLLSLDSVLTRSLRDAIAEFDLKSAEGLDALLQNKSLHAFFLVTLRIFPPVPILSRIASKGDKIGSLSISEKQKILVSVIGLHHDCQIYVTPGEVNLERWFSSGSEREHFIPFGMGRRRCGGALFGEREFKVAIATFIRQLNFSSELRGPMAFNWQGTLRRQGGQIMTVTPHNIGLN